MDNNGEYSHPLFIFNTSRKPWWMYRDDILYDENLVWCNCYEQGMGLVASEVVPLQLDQREVNNWWYNFSCHFEVMNALKK